MLHFDGGCVVGLGYVDGSGVKRAEDRACASPLKGSDCWQPCAFWTLEGTAETRTKSTKHRQRLGLALSLCGVAFPWGKQGDRKVVGLGQVISVCWLGTHHAFHRDQGGCVGRWQKATGRSQLRSISGLR